MRWWAAFALCACGRVNFDEQMLAITDAPAPDADKPFQIVDTLTVSSLGTPIHSAVVLDLGVTYKLRAIGTVNIQGGTDPLCDAEYWNAADPGGPLDLCDDNVTDAGLSIDDPVIDGDKFPKWGPFQPSRVYEIDFVGKGATIEAQFHDVALGNNVGSMTLEILAQ